MKGYNVTFKTVPHSLVPHLLSCKVFSRIEMQQASFMDHLEEFKGPSPELEDKLDIVAFWGGLHMVDLVQAMHERMVNGLWISLEKIEVVK